MAFAAAHRMLRTCMSLGLLLVALAGCSSPSPPGVYKLGSPYQIQGAGTIRVRSELRPRGRRLVVWRAVSRPANRQRRGVRSGHGHGRAPDLAAAEPGARRQPPEPPRAGRPGQRSRAVRRRSAHRSVAGGGAAARFRRPGPCSGARPVRQPGRRQGRAAAADHPARPGHRAGPRQPATQLVATAAAQCPGPFIQVGAFAERHARTASWRSCTPCNRCR